MDRRRSFAVLLLGLGLAACSEDPTSQQYRKAYASREACLLDNNNNAASCTPVAAGDPNAGGNSFLGPFIVGYLAGGGLNSGYYSRSGFVSNQEYDRRRENYRSGGGSSGFVPWRSGGAAGSISGGSSAGTGSHVTSPSTTSRGFFGGTGRAMGSFGG